MEVECTIGQVRGCAESILPPLHRPSFSAGDGAFVVQALLFAHHLRDVGTFKSAVMLAVRLALPLQANIVEDILRHQTMPSKSTISEWRLEAQCARVSGSRQCGYRVLKRMRIETVLTPNINTTPASQHAGPGSQRIGRLSSAYRHAGACRTALPRVETAHRARIGTCLARNTCTSKCPYQAHRNRESNSVSKTA